MLKITPNEHYLVLAPIEDITNGFAPPVKDDWLFEVVESANPSYPVGTNIIIKEITVKTDNYTITHIDNVVAGVKL